jgi:hypothetical protein
MNAHPHDDDGVPGTVYVLHFEPAYEYARHDIGWTAEAVDVRLQTHLRGSRLAAYPRSRRGGRWRRARRDLPGQARAGAALEALA